MDVFAVYIFEIGYADKSLSFCNETNLKIN